MRALPISSLLLTIAAVAFIACARVGLAERGDEIPVNAYRLTTIPRYDSCPDPADVLRDCAPLPLAINLHYFTTDECSRDSIGVTRGRRGADGALFAAEELVRNANQFFEEISDNPPLNNVAHGAIDHAPQCAPFRLLLAGVYFHCNEAYARKLPRPSRLRAYLVNADTEINYFLGNLTTSNGYASGLGSAMGAQGGYAPGVLAHELMHMLGINHVFTDDGCDDTWGELNYAWDKDGDGTIDQRGRRCWDWLPTPRNGDGTLAEPDYCAHGNYEEPHPCCDLTNMNANLMTYSNYASDWYKSSLSRCQVEKAVRHVVERKCDYLYGAFGRRPSETYVVVWPEPEAIATP